MTEFIAPRHPRRGRLSNDYGTLLLEAWVRHPWHRRRRGKSTPVSNVRKVFEPREEDGEVCFEVEPATEGVVSWFQRHPYLNADEPELVNIGGVAGKRLDAEVNVPEGYRDDHGSGCVVPCVPLFCLGGNSVTYITEAGRDRFAILEDVQGETVIIIVSAPVVKFDEFLPKAQKVIDTVKREVI